MENNKENEDNVEQESEHQESEAKSSPPPITSQEVSSSESQDSYTKVMNGKKSKINKNQYTLEAFGYLFMFINLYIIATAVGMILHFSAEKLFPIIGNPGSGAGELPDIFSVLVVELIGPSYGVISPLVPYLATLIVIYPFFAILFLWVNKRTLLEPEIRKLDMRKLLLYLTLAATFIFMIYKFIYLVMNLLTGNGSLNFLSHFFITVSINLTIFLYCFYELREDRKLNA